jgi:hypothetical protein
MYLDLCKSLKKIDEFYFGEFRPDQYKIDQLENLPLFVVIEAMTQAVCRACSKEFFQGIPAFPSQVSELFVDKAMINPVTFNNTTLLLKASVTKKANMGVGQCYLITENSDILASGCIWAARRTVNE